MISNLLGFRKKKKSSAKNKDFQWWKPVKLGVKHSQFLPVLWTVFCMLLLKLSAVTEIFLRKHCCRRVKLWFVFIICQKTYNFYKWNTQISQFMMICISTWPFYDASVFPCKSKVTGCWAVSIPEYVFVLTATEESSS